ncbi:MAG: GNAT family N-acetyltransferase [Bacteroidales bacterium]|nr:GNAT family N-acetyltransferase [Bacteroidales bacterium]
MDFREITIADRALIEHHIRQANPKVCDYSMHSLYCWCASFPTSMCVDDGFLILRMDAEGKGECFYSRPFGKGDFTHIIPSILNDASVRGDTARWFALDDEALQIIRKVLPHYGVAYHRGSSDYVYAAEDLRSLTGRKYQPKRNHLHQFVEAYDHRYEVLAPCHFPECMRLLTLWQQQYRVHRGNVSDHELDMLHGEEACVREAFAHYDALGLYGGVLYVEGRLVAFTYGSALSDDTFCTHIEKADESYVGVYAAINCLFAKHLPERFTFLNREDDMASPGLRQAKESYHPVSLHHKLLALPLTPTMQQIRRLWLACFTDDVAQDAEQFLLTRYNEKQALLKYHGDMLVSMLFIVPFHTVAYIYAVATHPDYRGRGFARQLLAEAMERCKHDGFQCVCLIPANDGLRRWYSRMGFEGAVQLVFHTHEDSCLGTGHVGHDIAMIHYYRPQPIPGKLVLQT